MDVEGQMANAPHSGSTSLHLQEAGVKIKRSGMWREIRPLCRMAKMPNRYFTDDHDEDEQEKKEEERRKG